MHEGKNMGIMTTLKKPTCRKRGWGGRAVRRPRLPSAPCWCPCAVSLPWQRLARLHACALSQPPPLRSAPALQELWYQSLQALITPLTALMAFESVLRCPSRGRQPVPRHPSCPCPAARGGRPWRGARARPGGVLARGVARGVRADARRGHQREQGWQVGGRGRWKRPFDFPIPCRQAHVRCSCPRISDVVELWV